MIIKNQLIHNSKYESSECIAVYTHWLCLHLVVDFNMKPVKAALGWNHSSIEENYCHTQSELNHIISNNKNGPSVIYSYKMNWETTDD